MLRSLSLAVYWFLTLIEWGLLVRCISSWFVSIPMVYQIYTMMELFTEPFVRPVRMMLDKIPAMATMPIDLSVFLTWMLIDVVKRMLI